MSTFTTTPTTTTPAYVIKVHLKALLDTRHERGEDSTALAIFQVLKSAATHYYTFASGRDYVIELSPLGEAYRSSAEHCMNYLIAFNEEYWKDSYAILHENIVRIMNSHLTLSRLRKLALLRSTYPTPTHG